MSSSSSKTFSFSSSCLFTIFHRKQWKFNQNNQLWRFWNKFYVRTQSTIFERSSRSTTLDSFSFSSSSFFAWSSAIVGMLKSLLYTKFVTKTCAETTSETQTFYDLSVWTLNFDDEWFRRRSTTEPTCIYLVHKWTMHDEFFGWELRPQIVTARFWNNLVKQQTTLFNLPTICLQHLTWRIDSKTKLKFQIYFF